jgi:hypothetical protein
VGDDIPLRASYGLTTGYDGKRSDGTLIGDSFDFAAHQGELAVGELQISTTYTQGDPAGDYPIYVKAGVFGNYEIYEGTEGDWEYFAGWRFAGVLHVEAADDEDNGKVDDDSSENPDLQGEIPATGDDAHLLLRTALLLTLLASLLFALASHWHTRGKNASGRGQY